ncbi:hypothetical protein [Lacticaseibacillus zhaodongensis]|uniref:hypothetical protein n=1 Tax=Lacticaseibacillus zhaodongensis TaxID=2668065 RepID=UPI0012D304A0|nr:hypothetical protein [Lacticaseibacillus zhaodongensis]
MASKNKQNADADQEQHQQLFTDEYFDKGHWLLKIWQTLVAILSWVCVFIPVAVTVISYIGTTTGRFKPLWSYGEGIFEIKFLAVVLLFLAAVAFIYTVAMTIIQVRRRDRLVEQWPTFNPIDQKVRKTELEKFMDQRFGEPEFRENVRNYSVPPEKNLDTDQFQKLFDQQREGVQKHD